MHGTSNAQHALRVDDTLMLQLKAARRLECRGQFHGKAMNRLVWRPQVQGQFSVGIKRERQQSVPNQAVRQIPFLGLVTREMLEHVISGLSLYRLVEIVKVMLLDVQ